MVDRVWLTCRSDDRAPSSESAERTYAEMSDSSIMICEARAEIRTDAISAKVRFARLLLLQRREQRAPPLPDEVDDIAHRGRAGRE